MPSLLRFDGPSGGASFEDGPSSGALGVRIPFRLRLRFLNDTFGPVAFPVRPPGRAGSSDDDYFVIGPLPCTPHSDSRLPGLSDICLFLPPCRIPIRSSSLRQLVARLTGGGPRECATHRRRAVCPPPSPLGPDFSVSDVLPGERWRRLKTLGAGST